MRTRNRSYQSHSNYAYYYELYNPDTGTKTLTDGGIHSYSFDSYVESIEDVIGNRRGENPCSHTKIQTASNLVTGSFRINSYYAGWYIDYSNFNYAEVRKQATRDLAATIAVTPEEAPFYTMYQGLLPGIKQELDESFANFAIDIKSFRSVPGLANRLWHLKAPLQKLARRKLRAKSAKELASLVANTNLFVHFGALPLIEDVQKLYASIHAMRAQYNTLKALCNKWITRHARVRLPQQKVETQSAVTNGQYISVTKYGVTKVNYSTFQYKACKELLSDVCCVKLRYRYRMPSLPDWLAKTFAYMDVLGLNFNPKIIWDATRFSFVVDWFIRISPLMNNLSIPMLRPTVELYKCVHSRSTVTRDEAFVEGVSHSFRPVLYDTRTHTYNRWCTVPPLDSIAIDGSMDWFKVHIGASLLLK